MFKVKMIIVGLMLAVASVMPQSTHAGWKEQLLDNPWNETIFVICAAGVVTDAYKAYIGANVHNVPLKIAVQGLLGVVAGYNLYHASSWDFRDPLVLGAYWSAYHARNVQ